MQILDDDIGRVPQNGQSLEVSSKWFSLLADAAHLLFWATLLLLLVSVRNRLFLQDDISIERRMLYILPLFSEIAGAYFLWQSHQNLRKGIRLPDQQKFNFGISLLRNGLLALAATNLIYILTNLSFVFNY